MEKTEFDLYKDIQSRTNGDIYIGVVGPVRTGKSTFINQFMEKCVIPYVEENFAKERMVDELPQSAQGRTIMTTEPKFVPQEAVSVKLKDDTSVRIRLVDCVGFAVDGVNGYMEGENHRMIKTPWYDEDISFEDAAYIGTEKVIKDHSTIAVMVTTDGSIGDIARENYVEAEKTTVRELNEAGKPYIIVLNTIYPYSNDTIELKEELEEKYKVQVIPINCLQMKRENALSVLEKILMEFPISKINFNIPKWVEMLGNDSEIKKYIISFASKIINAVNTMNDYRKYIETSEFEKESTQDVISCCTTFSQNRSDGSINIKLDINNKYYYQNISEMAGVEITSEYQLISLIKQLTTTKNEYDKIKDAVLSVQNKGYGVVMPSLSDIIMEDPVLISHGNKFGVKMNAISPSIHMIRANIETEIAPIVGSKEQAEDLITYIKENNKNGDGLWTTNIFGKSIGELMEDGIRSKIMQMDDECQIKLQETMQKIVNDSNGGMICIII